MSASLDFAAPKLGSGTRFKKLSATLASRGAKDPDALAAFIGRKNYGAKGMGRLSAGKSLANPDYGIYLAGDTLTCPSCGHKGSSGDFSSDSDDDGDEDNGSASKGTLRTPAPGTGFVRDGVPLTVKGGKPAHALSNDGTGVIDLDWTAFDADRSGGGSSSASQKAHDTASATAKATMAKRRMASKAQRAMAKQGDAKAKSASQLKPGHRILWGNSKTGSMEEHKVTSIEHKPNGNIKIHTKGPDGTSHIQTVSPRQQVGLLPGPDSSYGPQLSNTRGAVELATGTTRRPIHGPMDVLVKRAEAGTALLKHRQGGATIAALRQTPEGKWLATVNGRDLTPREHQRTALLEAVGTWNTAVRGGMRTQETPLQPEPRQTPLMEQYGIPAMRSAGFATATVGASDGPRVTGADTGAGDDGADDNGLTAKGQAIYKKLLAKGFPAARALAFAKNSQKTKAGTFGKAG